MAAGPPPAPAPPLRAICKSSLSGVSVVLRGRPGPQGQPPRERTLYLAHLTAPKMGNKERPDEPFAFESRDALRLLVVGREVTFSLSYTIPAASGPALEFGDISIPTRNDLDVAREMVAMGWAKVKDDRRGEDEGATERKAALRSVEDEARHAKRGLWAAEKPVARTVVYQPPTDLSAFVNEWKGKSLDGIVEQTSNGSAVRVRLMLTPDHHQLLNVQFAGTRAPRASSVNPATVAAADGADASHAQRNVSVTLLGIPPPPTGPTTAVIAIISHPAGSIAALLLQQGLARCQELHAGLLGQEQMASLRKAEAEAKAAQRGIWKHVAPKKPTTNGHTANANAYDAQVVRVWGGDSLTVRKGKNGDGEEVRLQLSSIRQPKPTDPKVAGLQAEAREVLRKRVIGKTVHCTVDYRKPAEAGYDAKDCATVTFNGSYVGPDWLIHVDLSSPLPRNIALQLVERGLVTVIRHRRDDDDRSSDIDRLMQAEAKAQAEGKGVHSGQEFPLPRVPDASENHAKAASFLPGFKRSGRMPAVVDFVMSGSRFKILLPKQDVKITLVLSGIRAPRTARNANEKSEPFGQEAYDFAMRRLMQRDVELSVLEIDRSGGFIGALWLNKSENFATSLVKQGLASVNDYSASQTPFGKELSEAEAEAKAARRQIWASFDHEAEAAAKAAEAEAAAPPQARRDYVDILLSDIRPDPFTIAVQILKDGGIPELSKLMSEFAIHHQSNGQSSGSLQPKIGDLASARFSEDGQWYRAKVKKISVGKRTADVVFYDYGNSETVSFDELRPLPDQFRKLAGQAREAVLSFIKLAGYTTDYGYDAVERFRSLAEGRPLVANIDYREPGTEGRLHLTLYDPADPSSRDETKSINAAMVRDGLAFIDRKCRYLSAYPKVAQALTVAHQDARKAHAGALQYGDIEDDD